MFDKNIPIPRGNPKRVRGGKTLAGVEGMEVGDSLLHPLDEYGDHTQVGRLAASASYYGRKNETAYEIRKMTDNSGIRIWRVK